MLSRSRPVLTFVMAVFGIGLLNTSLSASMPEPEYSPKDHSPGTIAVIGCSNTGNHLNGYLAQSDLDLMAERENLGGGSLGAWYEDLESGYWAGYDKAEPAQGYTGVWMQICLKVEEHDGFLSHEHQVWMTAVVAEVAARSGDIPVYVSPLNSFAAGHVCPGTGVDGSAVAAEVADWAAATFDTVERGPDTGPLGGDEVAQDMCHLSDLGQDVVGDQLVAWFDHGLTDPGPDPGPVPVPEPSPGDPVPPFDDIAGTLFEHDIMWLAQSGITSGCNPPLNDRFCPDDFVSRGEMTAFLSRALMLDGRAGDPFVDDDDSVFETDIGRVEAAGITMGCNPPVNDRFCPDDPVTRGQMAAFLARAFHLGGLALDQFVDGGSVFETDIGLVAAAGITKGCNPPVNDRFCPDDYVTRGQMAAFLHRSAAFLP